MIYKGSVLVCGNCNCIGGSFARLPKRREKREEKRGCTSRGVRVYGCTSVGVYGCRGIDVRDRQQGARGVEYLESLPEFRSLDACTSI